ncbi:MAG: PD40 domain-containing protein [Anaerolineae bacterium]|nr:PD40 domain-containing protein [Anaerolineae bacterium]
MRRLILGLLSVIGALWLLLLAAQMLGSALPAEEVALNTDDGRRTAVQLLDIRRGLRAWVTHGLYEYAPDWSPDGRLLAYIAVSSDASSVSVNVIDPFGGTPRTVFTDSRQIPSGSSVDWSPDGTRLAFTTTQDDRYVVYVADLANERVQQVTASVANAFAPTWSADGTMLAFSWSPAANSEIFAAALPGLDRPISSDSALKRLTALPTLETTPAWSPDGRFIAFVSDRDDNSEIYVLDTACLDDPATCESTLRRITNHPARDITPSWSPDGERLLFASNRDAGTWALYVLPAACALDCDDAPVRVLDAAYGAWRPRP